MPDPDPRAALVALVARLSAALRGRRAPIVLELLPLLADARVPPQERVAAAARVLRIIPDRPRPVLRVARALTVGLPPSRALERLRQLQNELPTSRALDALIEARERRVKMACPRCRVRLPRVEMVKHLWHEHGLSLEKRKTRDAGKRLAVLHARHTATGDTAALDRVAELAGAVGLRKWVAAGDTPAEEVAPLLGAAEECGAGLCPACFAEVPAAVTPLPPPLTLAKGRLSGDGYAVGVAGNAWFRTLAVTTPDRPKATGRRWLAPRLAATLVASLVIGVALFVAPSRGWLLGGLAVAMVAYYVVLFARTPRDPGEQAVDEAWKRLAPGAAERDDAARFLTRLCLATLGRGDPEARAKILAVVAARAAGRADDSDAELQLLAAAWVLQVEDAARFGRDGVAGVADLAAIGFRGERSTDFAEFVVGAYLLRDRDPGDLARLRVLLVAAAFEAGLVPRDLRDLWAAAPNLRRAMAVEPSHRLGLLFGLWRTRDAKAWKSVAEAHTVFDLARRLPRTAAGVLARFPDLMLYHRPEPVAEALVGPVLVCARGVVVGGELAADPDAEVRLAAGGRELVFGRHRIALPRKLPDDFADTVRAWLRFRAEGLLPFIDGYLAPGSAEVARRVLGPFCRKCKACGTVSAMGCGVVGRAMGGTEAAEGAQKTD
jgi:hypothetical protein